MIRCEERGADGDSAGYAAGNSTVLQGVGGDRHHPPSRDRNLNGLYTFGNSRRSNRGGG